MDIVDVQELREDLKKIPELVANRKYWLEARPNAKIDEEELKKLNPVILLATNNLVSGYPSVSVLTANNEIAYIQLSAINIFDVVNGEAVQPEFFHTLEQEQSGSMPTDYESDDG